MDRKSRAGAFQRTSTPKSSLILSSLAVIFVVAFAVGILAGAILGQPAGPSAGTTTGVRYARDEPLPPPDYYTGIDFDTLHSTANLTLIPLKSFQQQVTEYTCGVASSMTVMSYHGVPLQKGDTDELRIAREMNTYIGLDLGFSFNALGVGSGGSDHSSFASVKLPFVYYMAAMTADYHQPSDSVEGEEAETGDSTERIADAGRRGASTLAAGRRQNRR
jgi:hypothetical protein